MATSPQALLADYFDALGRQDLDAIASHWAPDGQSHIAGQADAVGPDGVRAYWAEMFAACPDFKIVPTEIIGEGDYAAVKWTATATFAGPGSYQGIEPTGARLDLEGMDLFRVSGDRLVREDAYTDGATFARQLGMLPPQGSVAEQRMTKAFNVQGRVKKRLADDAERIAEGVWLVRGGFPTKLFNVYLIEDDGGGVTLFDAGVKVMANALASAGAALGGINRIVLGHSHMDHRGAAPGLKVPVLCHPAERIDAEGDAGEHYFDWSEVTKPARWLLPRLMPTWDGGPVAISGTVDEGDDVSGFRVVHIPGHAPGQIALFRESDRVALSSDCFYTLAIGTGRRCPPRVPERGTNLDTEQARASVLKLAALEPSAAWPGHTDPVTGDVRAQLEQTARA